MKSYGTNIEWTTDGFEKRSEWVRYDSIGDNLQKVVSPLYKSYPNISKAKLSDFDDIIRQSDNFADILYFGHSVCNQENAETIIDLILNVVYPKTNKVDHFSILNILDFIKYCELNKFSSQERKLSMERHIDGEDYRSIKFEKIDDDETINLVKAIMKDVNLEDIRKKPALINYYVGQVMKQSKGKAPVTKAKELIEQYVKNEGK